MRRPQLLVGILSASLIGFASVGCSRAPSNTSVGSSPEASEVNGSSSASNITTSFADEMHKEGAVSTAENTLGSSDAQTSSANGQGTDTVYQLLDITEDYRPSFVHGDKGSAYQKYIVLHDTEGIGDATSVIEYWDSSGARVAAHFVVNKDGSIIQCVPLDKIAHHAGFGDTGNNELYGVQDESRDDKVGTVPIGSDYADYGMNSWSIGIELVHDGGGEDYPEEQLFALDRLIEYIDSYYGFQSLIIDHKAWRTTNSDTSAEFAGYLQNYQKARIHL